MGFRASHVRHHQVTTHHDHDEEVILPQKVDLAAVKYVLSAVICDPVWIFNYLRSVVLTAAGRRVKWNFEPDWLDRVIPETSASLRRKRYEWARVVVFGHLMLAMLFIATGNWFLILVFNVGVFYCGWLVALCGTPQHYGLSPNVPDHRLCCRSFTCGWLPAFLYWNSAVSYRASHVPGRSFLQSPQAQPGHCARFATGDAWSLAHVETSRRNLPQAKGRPQLPLHSRVADARR